MPIRTLRVKNFKTFSNIDINIQNFNVLIGANASGKSNFIRIFEFLNNISQFGLANAVSLQGGVRYLRNVNIGAKQPTVFEIVSDMTEEHVMHQLRRKGQRRGHFIGIKPSQLTYKLEIKYKQKGEGYDIAHDAFSLKCDLHRTERVGSKWQLCEKIGEGVFQYSHVKRKTIFDASLPEDLFDEENKKRILDRFISFEKLTPQNLLLEVPYLFFPLFRLRDFFSCAINDFDPKLPKKATPITGKLEFEEDGSNLALVMAHIISGKEKRRKFLNLLKDLLPFINKLEVEKLMDKSALIKLSENYAKDCYIPASFVSDGTINIVALIIALYFNRKELTIVEEPERNLHPQLISKVVAMMKDASRNKQIIVTTHNSEIVKNASINNLLLITRRADGFSDISRPQEKEDVRKFLENEIGLDELFIQNLF